MIHTFTLGRAARYYPERTAFASGRTRSTFRELHNCVASIAAALNKHGFGVGDRLATLLLNEAEYTELVYAYAWLRAIAVPLNTLLFVIESHTHRCQPARLDPVLVTADSDCATFVAAGSRRRTLEALFVEKVFPPCLTRCRSWKVRAGSRSSVLADVSTAPTISQQAND